MRGGTVSPEVYLIDTVEVGDDIQPHLAMHYNSKCAIWVRLLFGQQGETIYNCSPLDIRLSTVRGKEGEGARLCSSCQGWGSDPWSPETKGDKYKIELIATSNMPKNAEFNSQTDMLSLTHRGERRLDMLVGVGDQLFHTGEKVGHDHLERGSYISLT